MSHRSNAARARAVVLGLLATHVLWMVILPWVTARPPTDAARLGYAVGLGLILLGLAAVLYVAVTPALPERLERLTYWLQVAVVAALLIPAFTWAEPDHAPWAWMAGAALGGIAIGGSVGVVVPVALVLTGLGVLGAVLLDGPLVATVLIIWGVALVVWGTGRVLVWLLRLLGAAEAGREAEAALAVAHERLRLGRELHDVLGHRLGVIALKAELAADLTTRDATSATKEAAEIKELAHDAIAEARQAVQGDTMADLPTQLRSAELVLTSAGISTEVEVRTDAVPVQLRTLAAAMVREAVTNVLRHSDASRVSIVLETPSAGPTLVITNDGVRAHSQRGDQVGSGTGLAALAGRSAPLGARLLSGPQDGGRFEVRLELPTVPDSPKPGVR